MIQLRYAPKESDIAKIFNNPKILKAFEEEYKKNEILLRNKIAEYKQYLFLKSEELKESGEAILPTEEIISKFRQYIKIEIVYRAINLIFTTEKLDVEKNILYLIKDKEIVKKELIKKLIYAFENVLCQNGISESEIYEDMLMTKFVKENDN